MNCLLCHSESNSIEIETYQCSSCLLVFKNPNIHLTDQEDFSRYSFHQNDKNSKGYKEFLMKLLTPLEKCLPRHFTALDFGCGPGPVLSSMLKDLGGEVEIYDPHFFPDRKSLSKKYDVVTCTEVVEHFKNPIENWKQLTSLVKNGGYLAVMTQFFTEQTNYIQWWYKNDPTHVVFYSKKTLDFLASHFGFEIIFTDNVSVVILKNKNQ